MPEQLGRADLATMSHAEIAAAHKAGQLDDLLAGRNQPADGETPQAAVADQGARGSKYRNLHDWVRSLPLEEVARRNRESGGRLLADLIAEKERGVQ